jgi:hypothetical protein
MKSNKYHTVTEKIREKYKNTRFKYMNINEILKVTEKLRDGSIICVSPSIETLYTIKTKLKTKYLK